MASKLRRAPLFGLDNPLGIPALPKYTSSTYGSQTSSGQHCKFSKSVSKAAHSIPSKGDQIPPPIPPKSKDSASAPKMEVGLASYPQGGPVATGSPDRGARGSPRANLHVEFAQVGEMKERKEKYLTAKYGAHQMSLIRKRLGVEMWMYDQLQMLYQNSIKEGKCEEKEIDLDELLDIEDDPARRKYLQKQLEDCKQSSDKVENFTRELLERAKTL